MSQEDATREHKDIRLYVVFEVICKADGSLETKGKKVSINNQHHYQIFLSK